MRDWSGHVAMWEAGGEVAVLDLDEGEPERVGRRRLGCGTGRGWCCDDVERRRRGGGWCVRHPRHERDAVATPRLHRREQHGSWAALAPERAAAAGVAALRGWAWGPCRRVRDRRELL